MAEQVILRFDGVTFEYIVKKPILEEVSFSVRTGSKITLMGQNGAGKSTIFGLIKGDLKPKEGKISITNGATIGAAPQVVAPEDFSLTVEDYLAKGFSPVPKNIRSLIAKAMEAVNLVLPLDRPVGRLSGGQQARLLLASALIGAPDILLLDEPTNNLDKEGIDHLLEFLIMYDKTVLVISHDADFLNCFTEGVIYLDARNRKAETYVGDYYSVVEEISRRVEREQRKNAQLQKMIIDRKEKANFFSHKGGKMRKLAKKMREETEELEDDLVDVRHEDKTIRPFNIPVQEDLSGDIVVISSLKVIKNYEAVEMPIEKRITKKMHLLVTGPNGIGKSTFLRSLIDGSAEGAKIAPEVKVGYYSQDFTNLDFTDTVFESLEKAMGDRDDVQELRSVAAGFLITGDLMGHTIASLSEGQKGLLTLARLVLMRPGLLILDEPTNHINFRHLPVMAEAFNNFAGPMIIVSHMDDFVHSLRIDDYLELGKL
ncbi:MAG: ATP-binding cassette domain-containing protein [Patescibacteria group bacterium]|nr:ATP-binding cassette domain-containing protein [Patescibacteria group bacterium]MDD4466593.1 ATP-binding cassette domain-containing protein [Patescibacteria group bacterium]